MKFRYKAHMQDPAIARDTVFISKATPGDDAFVLWLAPRLEATGYKVFADILDLHGGNEWRGRLTAKLQDESIKMLLCCSDQTLSKGGVREEISIAEEIARTLGDPNFIIPLRIRNFKKLFGVSGLQHVDFESGWAAGLASLLKTLTQQGVPRPGAGVVQPAWNAYLRRRAISVDNMPEVLTSNWLRILSMPDTLLHIVPRNPASESTLRALAATSEFPFVEFGQGFLSFASPWDLEEHFVSVGPFKVASEIDTQAFLSGASDPLGIESRDAKSMAVNLLRQAWEKYCGRLGFLAHQFSSGLSFHVGEDKLRLAQRVPWGRQGERRNSMLRNTAKKKIWEYGVSVIPSLFPYPHMRLKGRVLFSEIGEGQKPIVISDKRAQFRLRRSVCAGWRNRAWHGRVMAFMELLTGESPYVDLPVGSGASITLDGMPIQFTAPVTARQTHRHNEDAEETDATTLGGYFEDEDA